MHGIYAFVINISLTQGVHVLIYLGEHRPSKQRKYIEQEPRHWPSEVPEPPAAASAKQNNQWGQQCQILLNRFFMVAEARQWASVLVAMVQLVVISVEPTLFNRVGTSPSTGIRI